MRLVEKGADACATPCSVNMQGCFPGAADRQATLSNRLAGLLVFCLPHLGTSRARMPARSKAAVPMVLVGCVGWSIAVIAP